MAEKYIICLGRQYGSGGHKVGQYLSEMLGIDYYDKEIIDAASQQSGISACHFERADEKAPGSLSHLLSTSLFSVGGAIPCNNSLSNDNIFMHQASVIRDLAAKGSCIIVGRCADYILRDEENVFSVFVSSPMKHRVKRIMDREGLTEQRAAEKARKMDKLRRSYYDYYTDKSWGEASSYNLLIDTSVLGEEQTACFIRDFVLRAMEDKK